MERVVKITEDRQGNLKIMFPLAPTVLKDGRPRFWAIQSWHGNQFELVLYSAGLKDISMKKEKDA